MGCSSEPHLKGKNDNCKDKMACFSEMIDWNSTKIIDIGYYPKFEDGTIVENKDYFFYPQDGNKIIQLDKSEKKKKLILELKKKKGKYVGAQICMSSDKLFIEYEGAIYCCDFGGENVEKLISSSAMKEKISSILGYSVKHDFRIVQGIKFYRDNLYLFLSSSCVVQFDLDSNELVEMVKGTDAACFYNDYIYYIGSFSQNICKMDIRSRKSEVVRGNKKYEKTKKIDYFEKVMEVDNQLYYLHYDKGENPCLYRLFENGEDKKIYEFHGAVSDYRSVNNDSTRVICEYHDIVNKRKYMQVYDIKSTVAYEMDLPRDFETSAFFVDDIMMYEKNSSDDTYLSHLKLK